MSSADESNAPISKKRKLQRACDYCRRKKIRCDGPQMADNRCSRCTARRTECTYKDSLQKGSYPSSYVENLESRLERMEKLVSKLCPDTDTSKEPVEAQHTDRDASVHTPASDRSRSTIDRAGPVSLSALTPQTPDGSDGYRSSDDDEVYKGVVHEFRKLSVTRQMYRYHGKSSGWVFIRSAIDLKDQYATDSPKGLNRTDRREPWMRQTLEGGSMPLFTDFPPDDLLNTLVDLYFRQVNDSAPLLHEPLFKDGLKSGLHLRHGPFGAIVLLVCAHGSRFTQDPRVLLEGTEEMTSSGWKWYQMVERAMRLPMAPAQLYDLQIYALMIGYLHGTSAPQSTWNLIGMAIRAAVDVGAHRKRMYSNTPTIEEELWRRVFWTLVVYDWLSGYGLGRPSSIHDEDIDVSLPTEVDDEYWSMSDPQQPLRQPEGKPSKITFFVCVLRLCQILAFANRTIYSISKSRARLGLGDAQWEERIVAELDSLLNKWLDSLPQHLRWDPDSTADDLFFTQTATLMAHYYLIQVAVHRPFMSASRRDSPLSFPSVIICTNAARSAIQVLDTLRKRTGTPYHRNMGALFMSGIVLMMNVWSQKRSGRLIQSNKDMAYVKNCIDMLWSLRREQNVSMVLCDILNELLSAAANAPVAPAPSPDEGSTSQTATTGPSASFASITFAQPKLKRTRQENNGSDTQNDDYALPLRPEYGRIPLFGYSASPAGTFVKNRPSSDVEFGAEGMSEFAPASSSPTVPSEPQASTSRADSGASQPHPQEFGGTMFGLEPLGYSEAVSLFPGGENAGSREYPAPQQFIDTTMMAAPQLASDAVTPDYAFIDDTLSMWSNAPSSFGWDDWGAYLSGGNTNSERMN